VFSLVCTVHDETGRANVEELRAILERIQPDVIFLEVPPADFDDYYENCSRQNLEPMAIIQYRQGHQVKLVPVDLPAPSEDFDNNNQYLFKRIEKVSRAFCLLIDSNSTYVRTEGFTYLNSERSRKLWSDIYDEMVSTIKWMKDPRLIEIYESWKETNNLREKAMMENILQYAEQIPLIGVCFSWAQHIGQAIIDISKEQSAIDSARMQWDFSSCRVA
jgi:hypothetical protein